MCSLSGNHLVWAVAITYGQRGLGAAMTLIGFVGLWAGLAALTLLAVMLPTWRPPKWLCEGTGLPVFPKDAWQSPAIQRQRSVLRDGGPEGH